MKCTYKINGESREFNSQELDSWLESQLAENQYSIEKTDLTLNTSAQNIAMNKLEEMKTVLRNSTEVIISDVSGEDSEPTSYRKIPGSIGVTKFVESRGKPGDLSKSLITPFDEVEFFDRMRKTTFADLSDDEFEKVKKNWKNSWDIITKTGIHIHKILECIIKNNPVDDQTRTQLGEHYDNIFNILNDFVNQLKERFGDDAIFLTEFPIISKRIHPNYTDIKSINGVIDLLIIDNKGVAHIFDLKTSIKQVGVWGNQKNDPNFWPTTKKNKNGYQLSFYRAILEQWGLKVAATEIYPIHIKMEYNDDKTLKNYDQAIPGSQILKVEADNHMPGFNYDYGYSAVRDILQVTSLTENINITKAFEPLARIAPTYSITTHVQRNPKSVEKAKDRDAIFISATDPERSLGQWKFYNPYLNSPNKWVFCKTDEELNEKLAQKLEKENENHWNEVSEIAKNVRNAISARSSNASPEEVSLAPNDNRSLNEYLYLIFKKYINGAWELSDNPAFIQAGIFVFTKNGIIEIISLTHEDIHQSLNLGVGDSILGALKKNRDVDENKILKATGGNLDLIKVMCILNEGAEVLENYKIGSIKSFNPWYKQGNDSYNETLLDNWSEVCKLHGFENKLHPSNFFTTLESTVAAVQDLVGDQLLNKMGDWTFTYSGDDIIQNSRLLIEKMERLKNLGVASYDLLRALRDGKFNFDDPIQLSYMLLGRALNKLQGNSVYIEKDPARWINITKDGFYGGVMVNSAYNSSSLNMRVLSKTISIAETHIRRKEASYEVKLGKLFREFYEWNNRNRLIGGEVKYFDNLFVHDADGNISKEFRLKHENDLSLAPEESKFIKEFLTILNHIRYKDSVVALEQSKVDGTYYQIPLAIGSIQSQRHTKGVVQAVKGEINEAFNFLKIFSEQEEAHRNSKHSQNVYNKYKISSDTRQQIIANHGVEGLETQLEKLLRDVIHTYTTEEVMQDYLPQLQGIKIALQYQQAVFGVDGNYEALMDAIDKLLDVNVYSVPIMDKSLQGVYKTLHTIKSITTATTLGLNFKSGMRELMQGVWVHLSRNMANAYGKDQFTKGDLAWAWKIVFQDMVKDPNTLTLVDALNVEYGMANADPYQIQDKLSKSKTGALNFNSDKLYFANRIPDSYHRMGILLAKMKHDGCYDAHEIVDDVLVYNFKKDNRFNLLHDSSVNKQSDEYRRQNGLYVAMLNQFNKEGWNLKYGDDLPRAYTIQEATSIKSFAELCFGHYDRSTQMLAKSMFLGSMILHFKTFVSSKIEQWILKPGTYNQGQYKQMYDENGEELVMIFYEEDGIQKSRIAKKSEVQPGDNWSYYQEWNGRFMEGIAYTMLDFGKALAKMNFQEWKELWANDTKRANFKLFLTDMMLMSILAWIISAMIEEAKNENELTALSHTFGSALAQSLSDGNIITVISSSFGDLNPPAFSIVKNLFNQTSGVISGDKDVWDAAVNSFGVFKSFKYAGEQLA